MLELVKLSIPVALSYLGLMTMNLVDLLAVGHLNAASTGAVGIGNSFHTWFMIFGIGLLSGMDYPVSHAIGAKRLNDSRSYFWQAIYLALAVSVPLMAVLLVIAGNLSLFGITPSVIPLAGPYLTILTWSLAPNLLFTVCRSYLQSHSSTRPALVTMVLANLLNIVLNYTLVFGNWGFPAWGAQGSATATLISRTFMMATLFWPAWRLAGKPLPLHRGELREIVRLGLPSAIQMILEVGVFALSTLLAGRLSEGDLAAHQIVLNIASVTFMIPLGVGQATAVLVARGLGEGHPAKAYHTGWNGLRLGVGFMAVSGLSLLLFPDVFLSFYTNSQAVTAAGKRILLLAALFQIFDGAQVVLTGALRGVADTRTPMLMNLGGHWFLGLPLGVTLCFYFGQGLRGIWTGLSAGLISVAILLLWAWVLKARRLR